MSRTAGNSKNEWVKNSHDSWSTASCSSSWQGAYSRLRPNLCNGSSSSPGESSVFFQGPQESKNPYHSRYGEGWVEKLKCSTAMSKFVCITDLIRFMTKEAEKLMKGWVHEDDFYIVHDSLVLMTTKETIIALHH